MYLGETGAIQSDKHPGKRGNPPVIKAGQLAGRLAFLLLAMILLWLPIPLGSNRLWAVSLLEVTVFLTAGFCALCWGLAQLKWARPLPGILLCVILWVGWLGWIGYQVQDQSLAQVTAWSPHRAELQSALIAVGASAKTDPLTLSVDPGVTSAHLLESAAYAALFFSVILVVSGSRARLKLILWLIMLSALAQSMYGSLMLMSGLEWGFWGAKEHYRGSATGTFVNRNHFAGYLELGIAAGVGLILATQKPKAAVKGAKEKLIQALRQWDTQILFSRVAVALLFVGLILSQSRMGNAAALGGLSIAGLLYVAIRLRRGSYRALALFVSILILDIWIVGGWFGLDELVERYEETEISTGHRADMWPDLKEMMLAYQLTGSGLGTFMFAYPEFHSEGVVGLNRHAHNDYAQFIIEVGLVGSAILGCLVLLTIIQALRILKNRRDNLYSGVAFAGLMAIFSFGIHSVTDFNLQIPANAATLVVLMACIWACSPVSSRKRSKRPTRPKSTEEVAIQSLNPDVLG